jgi:hypothetical protein
MTFAAASVSTGARSLPHSIGAIYAQKLQFFS